MQQIRNKVDYMKDVKEADNIYEKKIIGRKTVRMPELQT
jgi:hypothetical protein